MLNPRNRTYKNGREHGFGVSKPCGLHKLSIRRGGSTYSNREYLHVFETVVEGAFVLTADKEREQ